MPLGAGFSCLAGSVLGDAEKHVGASVMKENKVMGLVVCEKAIELDLVQKLKQYIH